MKKSTKRKIHKFIINTITAICGIVFLCTLASDSENILIPLGLSLVSGGWLCLWAWANGWLEWGGEK